MPRAQLVHRAETLLHAGGVWALLIALAWRGAFGYYIDRHTWYLHSQLAAVPLLIAALLLAGTLLWRQAGYWATGLLGGAAWVCASSLLPRYGWSRAPLPRWLLIAALCVLALAWLYRWARLRRWTVLLRGHGYEWIAGWAGERPLYARLLATRTLRLLGYWAE